MKTEAEIYLEYETAIAQADSLSGCAADMKSRLSEGLMETAGKTSSFWKGEGAGIFSSGCLSLNEDILGKAQALQAVSETVRMIAQNIYEAEMRALSIAADGVTE